STFLYRNNESIRLWAVDYLENRPINNENKIKKISNNSLLKFTAQLFKNSRNSIKKFYEMELSEKIYKVDNCETYFFYWEEATINYITQKIEKIFTDNNLDDKGSEISFSEGYIYINNNDKFYPISIPSSLKKDVSFINKNDFDRKLKTKELPKTILFNN
ncbi:MAG: hypothetical protein AB8B78_07760, partial [Polaribacter sp.]